MTVRKARKTFDREFKISTVKLVLDSERSIASIAEDLGISKNTLFNWKNKYREDAQNAFPGKGHMKPEEEEIRKLKKDLAHVTMERDILKKAVAFFAKDAQ
jgi:transposase